MTVLSPWQWFCGTRTLSNFLEAALTAAALFFWPWHWMLQSNNNEAGTKQRLPHKHSQESFPGLGEKARLDYTPAGAASPQADEAISSD